MYGVFRSREYWRESADQDDDMAVVATAGEVLAISDNGQIVYLPGRVSYAQILCSSTDVACSRLDGALLL